MKTFTILFTGGHHTSALAVLDWLKENVPKDVNLKIYWVGRKYLNNELSSEYLEVSKRNIPFYSLKAGKFGRIRSIRFLGYLLKNLILIPVGFLGAYKILVKTRPDLVLSFGGFLSVPVVIIAWFLKIRAISHEQTSTIGLANRINIVFLKTLYTAWPVKYYSKSLVSLHKLKYSGMPIRNQIFDIDKELESKIKLNSKYKTVLFLGGKEGAEFFNSFVVRNLKILLKNFNVILQTGSKNYYAGQAEKLIEELSKEKRNFGCFIQKKYILDHEIGTYFKVADFLVSRAGAHICFDLLALKKPAILVPLPVASQDEQTKNSSILSSINISKVLDENRLYDNRFIDEILDFSDNYSKIKVKDNELVNIRGQEILGNEILQILFNNYSNNK